MKLRTYLIALFLLSLIGLSAIAQSPIKINKKDFKTTKPGYGVFWDHLEAGYSLYMQGEGTYTLALAELMKAHEYNRYYPELNYLIGVCSYYTNHYTDAVAYFKEAAEFNDQVAPDLRLLEARALHQTYQFDSAAIKLQEWLDSRSKKQLKKVNIAGIQHEIEQCKNGMILMQDTVNIKLTNLGSKINSADDDYYLVFSPSWDRIYFTSRRQVFQGQKRNVIDNKYNEDIYVSYFEKDSTWGPAQNVGKPINSPLNDATLFFSGDGKTLYIYRGGKSNGDTYYTEDTESKWSKPRKVPSHLRSGDHESSVSFTEDGNTMYLVSNLKKSGEGKRDIYVSHKNEKGKWEHPVNLGPVINTPYNEEGVFVSPDGKKLFFSSEGHNSMGGFDVFISERDSGKWSEPVNLGFPVNSPANDLFFVQRDSITSYLSSNREGGNGLTDIYGLTYIPEIIAPVIDTIPVEVDTTPAPPPPVIPIPVVVPKPKPKFYLTGSVFDAKDSIGIMARIEVIDMTQNSIVATGISSRDFGNYKITLKKMLQYGVQVESAGYMFSLDIINIPEDSLLTEFHRDFYLKKIEVGQKVVLHHIFFAFNKSNLNPESSAELERVVKFLDNNPTLRIEISGHTDNVGSAKFNQLLSETRARSVVNYLVARGIGISRLEFKGYGFSQPVASNDTEEGRAENRRVEFKVIK